LHGNTKLIAILKRFIDQKVSEEKDLYGALSNNSKSSVI